MTNAEAVLLLVAFALFIVFVLFNLYLLILVVRFLRLACKFLRAQLDYYHSDCGN